VLTTSEVVAELTDRLPEQKEESLLATTSADVILRTPLLHNYFLPPFKSDPNYVLLVIYLTNAGVMGHDYADVDSLALLRCFVAHESSEVLLIDPSDHSRGYTKGATGARVLRVDLVVLWDVVRRGQYLEVDGNARPPVWREHGGVFQL
jgi:hypothetical protein